MIQVKEHKAGHWTIQIDVPEQVALSQIALNFSIPKEQAMVAVVNRGMDSIRRQVKQADNGTTLKQLWDKNSPGG